jgi:metal-sulfur cluster biosynthetic enzyme
MPLLEQDIWEKLKECQDPELPCNLVDLGLVYAVRIDGACVHIQMTLTTPSCPMADQITRQVQTKLRELPGLTEAQVELVYDPPWTPARISPAAHKQLGCPELENKP